MDREAWQATVHGFAKSRTQLSMLTALSRPLQSVVTQTVKNLLATQETLVQSLGREDALEKEMAITSSFLACRVPWTAEPGWLQSIGLQKSDMTERLTLNSPLSILHM